MNRLPILVIAMLAAANVTAAEKPNILIILADDMGYSDLGCYGSETATPPSPATLVMPSTLSHVRQVASKV